MFISECIRENDRMCANISVAGEVSATRVALRDIDVLIHTIKHTSVNFPVVAKRSRDELR